MSFQITIKEVSVEKVVKGKTKYSVANVSYDYQGEARTQKILSFTNPAVFDAVQELQSGDRLEVTTTKNEAGYNVWAKIEKITGEAKTAAAPNTGKVIGSNYETPQERAENRVRIVRQSSLSNAIATLSVGAKVLNPEDILGLAERYFDWVYETDEDTSGSVSE
jgi:hypothetical protein